MMRALPILFVMVGIGACAPSEGDKLAEEIAQSVVVGQAAAKQSPPYGLALMPGSNVRSSMMGGMGLQIETDSSRAQVANFYRNELERLGYSIRSFESIDNKSRIEGINDNKPDERLTITIKSAPETDGRFTMAFSKIITER